MTTQPPAASAQVREHPPQDFAVLFVDDEEKALKYFRKALQGRWPILIASSAAEALEVLAANGERIGVLVTDQRMPERTGVDLLREAKQLYPDMVRLLTTAYADHEATTAALNEGDIFRYIAKPWDDIQQLRSVISDAMELFLRRRREHELLEARRETLLALASNIAHELRTPLAGIRAGAQGMANYLPLLVQAYREHPVAGAQGRPISASHLHLLAELPQRLTQEVDQSNLVIDMLLATGGVNPIDPGAFSVQPIATWLKDAIARYPFQNHQRPAVRLVEEQDFRFRGSPLLLDFVLFNLLRNALYAIAATDNGKIELRLQRATPYNRLVLRDTGTGIAPEVLPRIFDDYFTTRPAGTGNGIGLAFCRRVVESFGGLIEARSQAGAWSEFTIQLPTLEEG